MHLFDGDALDDLVRLALREDVGAGDLTTEATVPASARGSAVAVAKSELILAGLDAAERTFRTLDPGVTFKRLAADGDTLSPGDLAFEVSGSLRTLLVGERTALNFVQRLSGVATLTRTAVKALEGTKTRLLDTRKTTPGFRSLEKRAVRAGGGHGHRTSLADGVMIKDNHVAAVGGITEAVRRTRAHVHPLVKIEVEVKNLDEVREAIAAGADMLLLDNMNDAQLAEAVGVVAGRVPTEASGNMSVGRLAAVARAGVDFVSMGALTHSAPAVDLSFAITQVAAR
jgi:nicotinate-nucleotide pyrophosphorylase (carboxylating)